MTVARPSLAAIIVNYAAADCVIAHLDRLRAELKGAPIVIVENASPGGDLARLRAYITEHNLDTEISVIDAGGNIGFARGNNLGLAALRERGAPDFVFMINPDAYPQEGCLDALLGLMADQPHAAVAGVQLMSEAGAPQSCKFSFPNALAEFAQESEIGAFQKLAGHRAANATHAQAPYRADWVSGTAMLVRLAAIDGALMDEDYFLYYEETDMMRTLTKNEWEIWHAPAARVVHLGGRSTGVRHDDPRPPRLPGYWFQSWRHYYHKHFGWPYVALAGAAKTAGIALAKLKCALRGAQSSKPKAYLRDVFMNCFVKSLCPAHDKPIFPEARRS